MTSTIDSNAVWDVLRSIPDPEFDVNIVDLGLIYSVDCKDGDVVVTMTLTTPNCPSGSWIYEGSKEALERMPGVGKVTVNMVFDPVWTPEMLSEAAQRKLGRVD
ncbi:MAG: iron-sulfur cluster assembly protein [Lacunisphaera sp.]